MTATTVYTRNLTVPIFGGGVLGFSVDEVFATFAANHLGSSESFLVNSNVTTRRTFLPFGPQRSDAIAAQFSDRSYTGQVDDSLGWLHYRARQFDSLLGRFLQADTLSTDGLNRYAYVRNMPTRATDPMGNDLCLGGGGGCGGVRRGDANGDVYVSLGDAIEDLTCALYCVPEEIFLTPELKERKHAERRAAAPPVFNNVVDFIVDEMNDNTQAIPLGIPMVADLYFYLRVRTGMEWDHKPYITSHYGSHQTIAMDGQTWIVYHDIWSNIHYGFVAANSNTYLSDDQWSQGHRSVGDTSGQDIVMVDLGISLAHEYGDKITREQLLSALADVLPQLRDDPTTREPHRPQLVSGP